MCSRVEGDVSRRWLFGEGHVGGGKRYPSSAWDVCTNTSTTT